MDYREMLERYAGRRVCVSTFGHSKLFGELAAVNEDCLRLINTTLSGDSDDQWLAQSQYGDPDSSYGLRHAETIIHFHHIVAITCLDDGLPAIENFSAAHGSSFEAGGDGGAGLSTRVAAARPATEEADKSVVDDAYARLHVERLEVRIGAGLIALADAKRGGDLIDRLQSLRLLIGSQLGFILPHTRVRDDVRLEPHEYRIFVNGSEVSRGNIRPGKLLAVSGPRVRVPLEGERAFEPAFAQPAVWIEAHQRDAAEKAGYFPVEPSAVLATHLQRDVRRYAGELFTIESLRALLENLRQTAPSVIDEVLPHRMTLARLHVLLSRLLEEDVSLRPLEVILERVAHLTVSPDDLEGMVVALRESLGRQICERFRDAEGQLSVFTLSTNTHKQVFRILAGEMRKDDGQWLAEFVDSLRRWYFEERMSIGRDMPIVVDSNLRRRLRQFLVTQIPTLPVLAYPEIPVDLPVRIRVSLDEKELGIARGKQKPNRSRVAVPVETKGGAAATSSGSKPRRPR